MTHYVLSGAFWTQSTVTWFYQGAPQFLGEIAQAFDRWDSMVELDFAPAVSAASADIVLEFAYIDGAYNVTLRRKPSDGALEAMISSTLWSTLRSHPRSRSCPPRMRRVVATGAMRTRSGWSRKAIGDIGRSQRQRGGMAFAVHC